MNRTVDSERRLAGDAADFVGGGQTVFSGVGQFALVDLQRSQLSLVDAVVLESVQSQRFAGLEPAHLGSRLTAADPGREFRRLRCNHRLILQRFHQSRTVARCTQVTAILRLPIIAKTLEILLTGRAIASVESGATSRISVQQAIILLKRFERGT